MKSSSIALIKEELLTLRPGELTELCLRLARFKKENKELLTYLLFEAGDEPGYIQSIRLEITELFGTINHSHLYFAKKTLRKIVRLINKYSRYSGNKQTDIELRLYFCQELSASGIPVKQNAVIHNLYNSQLKKIKSTIETLHEDLQHDYKRELDELTGR